MILLTQLQKEALPHIKWLLSDGPRASGRTTLLAIVFIEMALEHPGKTIEIWDHIPTFQSKLYLAERIMQLWNESSYEDNFDLILNKTNFTIKVKQR